MVVIFCLGTSEFKNLDVELILDSVLVITLVSTPTSILPTKDLFIILELFSILPSIQKYNLKVDILGLEVLPLSNELVFNIKVLPFTASLRLPVFTTLLSFTKVYLNDSSFNSLAILVISNFTLYNNESVLLAFLTVKVVLTPSV